MGLWQRQSRITFDSIKKSHSHTLKFNIEHPPNLWTTKRFKDSDDYVFPYVQVSLILHEDAEQLVKAVRADIDDFLKNMGKEVGDAIYTPMIKSPEQFEQIRERFGAKLKSDMDMDELMAKKWSEAPAILRTALLSAIKERPAQAIANIMRAIFSVRTKLMSEADLLNIDSAILKIQNLCVMREVMGEVYDLNRISKIATDVFAKYSEGPLSLFTNCVRSLGTVPPETGLRARGSLSILNASAPEGTPAASALRSKPHRLTQTQGRGHLLHNGERQDGWF